MDAPEPASTFPQLLAQVATSRAEHTALIVGAEAMTYSELNERTGCLARALLSAGAGKGARIAVMAPDCALLLTMFYAALRIGALVTPISTLTTPNELSEILRTSDAQFLITQRRMLTRDFGTNLEAALPGLAKASPGQLCIAEAPYLRSIWTDDVAGLPWALPIEKLLEQADRSGAPDATILAAVENEVSPGDDAFVVYTSGSTAAPKAVVHSQWSVARQPPVLATYFDVRSSDRTLCLLPGFWMGGISAVLQVLSTGSTLVYPTSPDVEAALDAIETHRVTNVVVWHMLAKLRSAAAIRGIDLAPLKITTGPTRDEYGTPIPAHLHARMLGMSESFAPHSAEPVTSRLPESKAGAAGRAVNGIERRVVDPDTGAVVPPGEIGELQLRGGALMTGFYKMPRSAVFTADGFYPTKDLVRIDADGYAYFIGRISDMIKTNSANVSRLEVEAALNNLPEVEMAIVAGLPDPELGELVAAAVIPEPGSPCSEADLKMALREVLSSYKIPRRIVFITHADIPRTPTGKVALSELAAHIESHLKSQTQQVLSASVQPQA